MTHYIVPVIVDSNTSGWENEMYNVNTFGKLKKIIESVEEKR